jgi:hypothetical protein
MSLKLEKDFRQYIAGQAAAQFGRPRDGWTSGDNRVGFTCLHRFSESRCELVMVAALPPSSVGWVETTLSAALKAQVYAADWHVGNVDGSACGTPRETVARHVEGILARYLIPGEMIGEILAARRLAYTAARAGHRWGVE